MSQNQLPILALMLGCLITLSACSRESQQADAVSTNKAENTEQQASASASAKFSCTEKEFEGRTINATIVTTSYRSTPVTIIHWKPDNYYFGERWSPETRCQEVSRRFQMIYDRDALKYITADTAKWIVDREINVICSVKSVGTRCEESDLLFTLEAVDDPNVVLNELLALRQSPSTNSALLRGEDSPETFAEGKRVFYDLEKGLQLNPSDSDSDSRKVEPAF